MFHRKFLLIISSYETKVIAFELWHALSLDRQYALLRDLTISFCTVTVMTIVRSMRLLQAV